MSRITTPSPLSCELTCLTTCKINQAQLLKRLQAAQRMLKTSLKRLSLALVGDRQMSALHRRFLGISGPTDVLTFPLEFDSRGKIIVGEVVICVPEARRRAAELGHRLENEVLLYALHGMLHLSGFDDRTAGEYNRMHRTEDQILKELGVGAVFHRKACP